MGGLGGGGYYNPTYRPPTTYKPPAYQYPVLPPAPPAVPPAVPQYTLPPAPSPVTLPTPTPLPPPPQMPALPPAPMNDFLQQLKDLIPLFQNQQAFGQLSPEIQALLDTQKNAALAQFDVTQRDALDKQLASLFGRGLPVSSIAANEAGKLAIDLGAARAGIDSQAAAQLLAAMQYQGQFGQQNLGALAGILGSGASLEQGAYRDQINAMLQRAGLDLQSYGQQSSNILNQNQLAQSGALGVGGLNQQQYGTQTGNILQQQQMQQQYALAQQQMMQALLQQLLGQIGNFSGGGFSGGGSSSSPYNYGGSGGGLGGRGYYTPTSSSAPNTQQDLIQWLMKYLEGRF